MPQNDDQDEKIHDLSGEREPVDLHGQWAAFAMKWVQKGFASSRIIAMTKQ
jgi:hypothetical protein